MEAVRTGTSTRRPPHPILRTLARLPSPLNAVEAESIAEPAGERLASSTERVLLELPTI